MSCSNATIVLRSPIKAFVLSIESISILNADISLTDGTVEIEVSPGAGGEVGKIMGCVAMNAKTSKTLPSEIQSFSVLAERLRYRAVGAADGGMSVAVGCLMVLSAGSISQFVTNVNHVEMESVVAGSTLRYQRPYAGRIHGNSESSCAHNPCKR
ncbi:Hypothetical protein, putative [Bodo saltans]|uniref:Uncharacterized protein n=1 Tax=Bodo saltans TaxID=75058 RepID=A0A0S4JLV8_BODSA|nr:Hypothetical protein, putative [Bodo saltans]|eukprot:CUG90096.1 Hypothetical protein, putative [Bodo saltans]